MSKFNKIILVIVSILLAGCAAKTIPFTEDNFTHKSFYQLIPNILNKQIEIDSIAIYELCFTEKPYEGYYVIDYSEVNSENDNNILHYKSFKGFYQKLYLLRFRTRPTDSLTIYFSLKYNAFDECIGFGPAYLGYTDNNRKLIVFSCELYTRKKKNTFMLKRISNALKIYMNEGEFEKKNFINIDKIIVEKSYSIGNNVVIDVSHLFRDSLALKFNFIDLKKVN